MPRLVPLDENWDPAVALILGRRRLHHDPARVLLQLVSNFVRKLRILAVIRVIRHVAMLVRVVLISFRLVRCAQIRSLSLNVFDVALSHQMAALLHKLVLDLAHAIE
mmetsp:Transcript_28806/g.38420  ORF Transcript_28806/g.38420 Transcript_28806/m.38420 type:complete len:107 (-) Transcript_28806:395-715(-)